MKQAHGGQDVPGLGQGRVLTPLASMVLLCVYLHPDTNELIRNHLSSPSGLLG